MKATSAALVLLVVLGVLLSTSKVCWGQETVESVQGETLAESTEGRFYRHSHGKVNVKYNYSIVVDIGSEESRVWLVGLPNEKDLSDILLKGAPVRPDLQLIASWKYEKGFIGQWQHDMLRHITHAVQHYLTAKKQTKTNLYIIATASFRHYFTTEEKEYWKNYIVRGLENLRKSSKDFMNKVNYPYFIDMEGDGDGGETMYQFYAINLVEGTLDKDNSTDFAEMGTFSLRYVVRLPDSDYHMHSPFIKELGWKRKQKYFMATFPRWGHKALSNDSALLAACQTTILGSAKKQLYEPCRAALRAKLFPAGPKESPLNGKYLAPWSPDRKFYALGFFGTLSRTIHSLKVVSPGWQRGKAVLFDRGAKPACTMSFYDLNAHLSVYEKLPGEPKLFPSKRSNVYCLLTSAAHVILAEGLKLEEKELIFSPPKAGNVLISWPVGVMLYHEYIKPSSQPTSAV